MGPYGPRPYWVYPLLGISSIRYINVVLAPHQYTYKCSVGTALIGVRDLPLRDMLSLGAWRMGLGCSGNVVPPSSSASPGPFEVDS